MGPQQLGFVFFNLKTEDSASETYFIHICNSDDEQSPKKHFYRTLI
jgi:hypothetical protein